MKFPLLMIGLIGVCANPLYSQSTGFLANGPNAPAIGSIVPDEVTFAYSTTPVSQFGNFLQELPNLEYVSYSAFPNEIVVTLYHTPW